MTLALVSKNASENVSEVDCSRFCFNVRNGYSLFYRPLLQFRRNRQTENPHNTIIFTVIREEVRAAIPYERLVDDGIAFGATVLLIHLNTSSG